MAGPMRKVHDLTAVAIERVETSDWSTGARPSDGRSAYAEVKVTQGTNSPQRCSNSSPKVTPCSQATLGTLPEATYVVVHEISGASLGLCRKDPGSTPAVEARLREETPPCLWFEFH
jgi:phenylpyruvate tautomerase PptA (4-oxalocrotonate tautomerase family)